MLNSSPDDPFLHYGLAMQDRAEGDLAAALSGLQKVLELDADYLAAYFHHGQVLAEQGEHERAREILTAGIAVAGRVGDQHALQEMTGFLQELS
jgi:tetratricopeptide (TPR) repeat protein